jgi:integrase
MGQPKSGPVFPALRGEHAGEGSKHGVSHAEAMRRDLERAFGIKKIEPYVVERKNKRPLTLYRWKEVREHTNLETELLKETEFTRPVDFHSWRRAFVQKLGDIGLNAQQAQKLAGHADLSAHERYLRNTTRTLVIPSEALPDLTTRVLPQPQPKLEPPDTQSSSISSTPGRTRTCDQWVRKAHSVSNESALFMPIR